MDITSQFLAYFLRLLKFLIRINFTFVFILSYFSPLSYVCLICTVFSNSVTCTHTLGLGILRGRSRAIVCECVVLYCAVFVEIFSVTRSPRKRDDKSHREILSINTSIYLTLLRAECCFFALFGQMHSLDEHSVHPL